jgi:hypothetical protein
MLPPALNRRMHPDARTIEGARSLVPGLFLNKPRRADMFNPS